MRLKELERKRLTMSGDGEARKLGEKLLLDVEVEGLSSVGWTTTIGFDGY